MGYECPFHICGFEVRTSWLRQTIPGCMTLVKLRNSFDANANFNAVYKLKLEEEPALTLAR
jgi:hypothetical protein